MSWYKKVSHIKLSETQKEKKDFFEKRTNRHIKKVQNASEKIVKKYPEYKELLEQVKEHDASKFKEPEMSPYIKLTWNKKEDPDAKSTKEMNDATLHHIKNNKHHPEYHNKDKANISSTNRDESIECISAKNMDDISLAEMVADWQAMAEELKTNTAREWYNDVKEVRWSFNKKQEKLIDKLLKALE
jgi:hypothetical protein